MSKPLLIAVVCAGLPACAALATPPGAESLACAAQDRVHEHPPPATGALPARAGTGPAPERGTVAPSTRVASHIRTPSMRAMERATAAREATAPDADKTMQDNCKEERAPGAPAQGAPTTPTK